MKGLNDALIVVRGPHIALSDIEKVKAERLFKRMRLQPDKRLLFPVHFCIFFSNSG